VDTSRSPGHLPAPVPSAVLHVPHSSTTIPPDVRRRIRLTDAALRRQLHLLTDWFADALFALPPETAVTVRFPVSRLVVDPERFLDDDREPMAARGMGVIYTRTTDGKELRRPPTAAQRTALIARYYRPHHAALDAAVDAALAAHGRCLLVDCHSFPSRPLPCDLDQTTARPDICLGTDPFHTPRWLVDFARQRFAAAGFRVEVDRPFRGALVPAGHYVRDASVSALMIEVGRRLCMDEGSGEKGVEFEAVRAALRGIVLSLVRAARNGQPTQGTAVR
jgi:N-formylglutamate amidohydrolase